MVRVGARALYMKYFTGAHPDTRGTNWGTNACFCGVCKCDKRGQCWDRNCGCCGLGGGGR